MRIRLDRLEAHPDHLNQLDDVKLKKLTRLLEESGRYPPLIVRRLGAGQYQILDGHQRVKVLESLNHTSANCVVWEVDDEQAVLLLLTLNRLRGTDKPRARGELIARLNVGDDLKSLSSKLPEDMAKLRKLLDYTSPPPQPQPATLSESMPHPVTFFLTKTQRRAVLGKLRTHAHQRTDALLMALGIKEAHDISNK
ncbi:MAG: ParB N-terminal domain-containing protein [Planctomycetota bacterium]|nr:ParB N-terminal domain-containing protein [Planctomycetota bacterium]